MRTITETLTLSIAVGFFLASAGAQIPSELILYPELVIHNGKVVTVDDNTFSTHPGTIVEALAARDGKILALGSNEQILALKGAETRVIDLQGRTVLPGIIDTHSHLQRYAIDHFGWRTIARQMIRISAEPDETWADVKKKTLNRIKEEAASRDTGEWINLTFPRGGAVDEGGTRRDARQANLRGLLPSLAEVDEVAPNHPVYMQAGASAITNSRAQELIREVWYGLEEPELMANNGVSSNTINRIMPSYFMIPDIETLAEIYRQENMEWASFGITTWASSMRSIRVLAAYQLLDSRGELGLRVAYAPASGTPLQVIPQMLAVEDYGSDYLWGIGSSRKASDGAYPTLYTSIEPPLISAEVKSRELVLMTPERRKAYFQFIEDSVAAGQRFANSHTAGDQALELTLDAIEKGSQRAGLSLEEIRAKRHVIDHCTMNPRPDQIPRLKKLGIMMSCAPKYIENTSERVLRDYGERYVSWIAPAKSLIDGGVKPVLEIDTHAIADIGTVFHYLGLLVNRAVEGRIFAGSERVHRVQALKMSTAWAAEYVLREDVLGSLEKGKFADFIVIDKDYLDIPAGELGSIQALLTVVGGKIVYQAEESGL